MEDDRTNLASKVNLGSTTFFAYYYLGWHKFLDHKSWALNARRPGSSSRRAWMGELPVVLMSTAGHVIGYLLEE